jgi:hypothetical protein
MAISNSEDPRWMVPSALCDYSTHELEVAEVKLHPLVSLRSPGTPCLLRSQNRPGVSASCNIVIKNGRVSPVRFFSISDIEEAETASTRPRRHMSAVRQPWYDRRFPASVENHDSALVVQQAPGKRIDAASLSAHARPRLAPRRTDNDELAKINSELVRAKAIERSRAPTHAILPAANCPRDNPPMD